MSEQDPYAQQKAVAQSMQEAIDRNERAEVLSKLNAVTSKLDEILERIKAKAKKE